MMQNQLQWYGTQFHRESDGRYHLYPVNETAVSDEQRRAMFVPPLSAAREREAEMNR